MDKKDIKMLTIEELKQYLVENGEKPFRAKQIYKWLHEKLAFETSEMTDISNALKEKIDNEFDIQLLEPIKILTSKTDGTQKFLFRLLDGNIIESVLMRYKYGNTVCISTQVGCRMGCRFCASTLDGLVRNLRYSEMLEEIYQIQKYSGERVSNVVLMGSGEPMDNFDNVVQFVLRLSDENGLHISQRNITISSCGLVENIKKSADMHLQVTLALSLHAADNEKRRSLMQIANKYEIHEVLDACQYF